MTQFEKAKLNCAAELTAAMVRAEVAPHAAPWVASFCHWGKSHIHQEWPGESSLVNGVPTRNLTDTEGIRPEIAERIVAAHNQCVTDLLSRARQENRELRRRLQELLSNVVTSSARQYIGSGYTDELQKFLDGESAAQPSAPPSTADTADKPSPLNSDTSSDEARALHRVVRAMHDGNCPKCGMLAPSEYFYIEPDPDWETNPRPGMHKCPNCDFTITDAEAQAAMQAFRPYMQNNLAVFEAWRARLKANQSS